jgi:cytochrome P450
VSTAPTVAFNPFEPGFFDDPYPQYASLRERDPVHTTPIGPVALFRYEDVFTLLRNPTLSVDERNTEPFPVPDDIAALVEGREDFAQLTMLNRDPPDHDRLRRLVSRVFTPRRIEQLRPRVTQLVDGALDAAAARGDEMDVIAQLAFPLPFQVISDMLGMPEADGERMRDWSHTMTKMLDPIVAYDDVAAALHASDSMLAHVRDAIAWKRREPADDLLSALVSVAEDATGEQLSEEELVAQVVLLYIAGHETTVNLIGNGTLALLRHPDQLARLRDDPSLDANAVEELLRFDSPVQFSRRIALADFELDGHRIEAKSFVLTCLGAANHDPEHWGPTADELDLGRAGAAQHISFGSGVHHCLGAALARVEGRAAFTALTQRFPDLALADAPPAWNNRIVLRGLDTLPLTL